MILSEENFLSQICNFFELHFYFMAQTTDFLSLSGGDILVNTTSPIASIQSIIPVFAPFI